MIRILIAGAAAAAAIALPATTTAGPNGDTVKLLPVGASTTSGTADLMQIADGTKVFVHVFTGAAPGERAHIAAGTCGNLPAQSAYGLQPLAAGKSTTVLHGVALNTLDGRLSGQAPNARYSVVVERSSDSAPVACGDIRPG